MLSRRQFLQMAASSLVAVGLSQFVGQVRISSGAANRQIPVLAYHRVGHTTDALTVTPERFTRDLNTLQEHGYTSISLEQFQSFLDDRNVEMPEKPVLLTFDDGYADNYQHAFPILQEHSMTGSFFIIAGMLQDKERVSPENIKEMARHGMSFGSHTISHRALAELSDEEVYRELMDSRGALEDILGRKVDAIAYPRGSYNEAVVQTARNNGYSTGFTVREGTCLKESPDFELRRIPIFRYDGAVLSVMAKRGSMSV